MKSPNRPLRIAVADDDPRLLELFQQILQRLGHEVVVLAADGDELLAGCLNCQPDLIISDFHMPRMNGMEAIQRIWQVAVIPAIVLTGLPDAKLVAGGKGVRSPICLLKPVTLVELCHAINRASSGDFATDAADVGCGALRRRRESLRRG